MIHRAPILCMAAALLALVGLFDSAYLSLERLRNGAALVCPTGGGCTIVQGSTYSTFLGIPVAFLGVAGYLVLVALALLSLHYDKVGGISLAALLLGVSSIGVLFSLYLSYLQVGVIGAICFWCVVSALIELSIWVMALLNWWQIRQASMQSQPHERPQGIGAGSS